MKRFGTIWSLLFLPLTVLYSLVSWIRFSGYRSGLFRSEKLPVPVWSVGNLTAGGSGKTPVTAWLARLLTANGLKVGIISRGYGRKTTGTVWVCREGTLMATAETGGDEPVELATLIPGVTVVVSERRVEAGRELLRQVPVDLILADDGFQHRRLFRNLDILVQDLPSFLSNRFQLPSGRFRQNWKHLAAADVVIWTKGSSGQVAEAEKIASPFLPGKTLHAVVNPEPAVNPVSGNRIEETQLPVFAFCGIAFPDKFFDSVREAGYNLAGTKSFPDHYPFTKENLTDLARQAESSGAVLLTTLKDYHRLTATPEGKSWAGSCQVHVLPLTLAFPGKSSDAGDFFLQLAAKS
ncbi:MAG: tetraacyldisaccharide 4'-kinase [Bacteroidetes bacterium]|nr:tetraacyldisaccharide 4'-kinase [Bacteroidota bacterium]